MNKIILQGRFKKLATAIFKLIRKLQYNSYDGIIFRQLIDSSSSASSNYRAASRAKSKRDFINKLKIVEEETDETLFWLEYSDDVNLLEKQAISTFHSEGSELLAIITASLKTLRGNENN